MSSRAARSSTAGGSAAAEHHRRSRRERRGRLLGGAVGAAAHVMVVASGAAATGAVGMDAASLAGTRPGWRGFLAVGALLMAAAAWLRRDRHSARWAQGARGEVATAQLLATLGPRWTVLHDLAVPGSRANIDHVVVGPSGVAVIDSKQWSGVVRAGRRHVRRDGRRCGDLIDRQHWYREVVEHVMDAAGLEGVPVRSIVAVHGASVRRRWWVRTTRGVRVVDGPALRRSVTRRRRRLPAARRAEAVSCLERALGRRLAG